MITELGHFALILAFAVAIVQAVVPMIGAWRKWPGWMAVAEPAAGAQFALTAVAFGALMWAFITSDFSLQLVTLNSHAALAAGAGFVGAGGDWGGVFRLYPVHLQPLYPAGAAAL